MMKAPQYQATKMLPSLERRTVVSPKGAQAIDTQRPRYYKVNGTGRDTYIQSNNGGFTTRTHNAIAMDPRIVFKNGLRDYEPDDTYLSRRQPRYSELNRRILQNEARVSKNHKPPSDSYLTTY